LPLTRLVPRDLIDQVAAILGQHAPTTGSHDQYVGVGDQVEVRRRVLGRWRLRTGHAATPAGHVQVTADPADRRSCLVTLTPAGAGELQRLTQAGLERFALFVADWPPGDVRMLTTLLDKLRNSIAAVAAREHEQRPAGRRWAGTSRQD
jgi:hypothetical protein